MANTDIPLRRGDKGRIRFRIDPSDAINVLEADKLRNQMIADRAIPTIVAVHAKYGPIHVSEIAVDFLFNGSAPMTVNNLFPDPMFVPFEGQTLKLFRIDYTPLTGGVFPPNPYEPVFQLPGIDVVVDRAKEAASGAFGSLKWILAALVVISLAVAYTARRVT